MGHGPHYLDTSRGLTSVVTPRSPLHVATDGKHPVPPIYLAERNGAWICGIGTKPNAKAGELGFNE
jgi:hypothetical protein